MKEFIVGLLISICLLYVTFQTGRRVGVTETKQQIVELQDKLDYCETKWKLDIHLFFEKEINEICKEQFEQMGC